jgi:hypothetical protein
LQFLETLQKCLTFPPPRFIIHADPPDFAPPGTDHIRQTTTIARQHQVATSGVEHKQPKGRKQKKK